MGLLTRLIREYKINLNFQAFSTIRAMNFRDSVVTPVYCGITLALSNSRNI